MKTTYRRALPHAAVVCVVLLMCAAGAQAQQGVTLSVQQGGSPVTAPGSAWHKVTGGTPLTIECRDGKTVATNGTATVNWGAGYRKPTQTEFGEFCNNCTWSITYPEDGDFFFTVTGSNGNYIIQPRAYDAWGNYWSATLSPRDSNGGICLCFSGYAIEADYGMIRCASGNMRPVRDKSAW